MGIDIHVYSVYGVKVDGYDTEFSDAYEEVWDDCPLEIITDGMNGEYMVFGKQLFDSGNLRFLDSEDTFKNIDITNLADIEKEYKLEFVKCFPKFAHYMEQPFQLLMFTHYS